MSRAAPDLTGRPTQVVQRLRLRYAKRGRLRFTSHRDVARAFERAVRRADLPLAFSSGFTAHPKISWVGAAPTGVASEAEYLEIALAEERDPEAVRRALDEALPPGLDILDCVTGATREGLPDLIDASLWRIRLPGVPPEALSAAVVTLLAAGTAPVQRLTKGGMRTIDVRAGLVEATVEEPLVSPNVSDGGNIGGCAILRVVVRQTTPAVRPDDVLAALRTVAGLEPPVPPEVTRLGQGRLATDGSLNDPLNFERAGATPAGRQGVETAPANPSTPNLYS